MDFGTWHYSRECGNSPNKETGVGIPVHSCARYNACSATTEEVVGGVVLDQPLPPHSCFGACYCCFGSFSQRSLSRTSPKQLPHLLSMQTSKHDSDVVRVQDKTGQTKALQSVSYLISEEGQSMLAWCSAGPSMRSSQRATKLITPICTFFST